MGEAFGANRPHPALKCRSHGAGDRWSLAR
jgi:hypothetical protein